MKSLFTLLFAIVSITTFAQKEFQGKATYMSKTTMDMSRFSRNGQMSERVTGNPPQQSYALGGNSLVLSVELVTPEEFESKL